MAGMVPLRNDPAKESERAKRNFEINFCVFLLFKNVLLVNELCSSVNGY
jgi:hypothetical protein